MGAAGDAVHFVDDERLDIPDAEALQELVYEYAMRALGGLVGAETSGVLGELAFDTSTPSAVPIPACLFYVATEDSGDTTGMRVDGQVIRYDPTDAAQIALGAQGTTVDVSAYALAETKAFLWARRVTQDVDTDTRRRWDVGTSDEVAFSAETRTREYVVFGTSANNDTTPDANSGWFKFAQIALWTAGDPTITTIHPFDLTGDNFYDVERRLIEFQDPSTSRPIGIALAITKIIEVLRNHLNSAGANDWRQAPSRGLQQLDTDLTTAEADIAALEAVNTDFAGVRILYHGAIEQTGATTFNFIAGTTRADAVSRTMTRQGVGEYEFVIGADVTSVVVTPKFNDNATNDSMTHGTDFVTAFVGPLAYDGGPNETTFTVYLAKDDGTKVDQSFFLTASGNL